MAPNTGAVLVPETEIVNVSLSTKFPVPESVTVIVTEGADPPRPSAGVQEKAPVLASMVMPAVIEAASKLNVKVSAGKSLSVAVAVKDNVASSSTV